MDFDEILKTLKKELSKKRYIHSLAVGEEAANLAEFYGADKEKAKLAGVLHDCAKHLSNAQLFQMCSEFRIDLSANTYLQPEILHGFVGANLAKTKFGINDNEIYDAIFYHTTAKPDMPLLTKIIFIADYIEPNRIHNRTELDKICEQAYENLDDSVIMGLDFTISHLIKTGSLIFDLSVEARNYYISLRKRMNIE